MSKVGKGGLLQLSSDACKQLTAFCSYANGSHVRIFLCNSSCARADTAFRLAQLMLQAVPSRC